MAVYFDINICAGPSEASVDAMIDRFSGFDTVHAATRFEVRGQWWTSLIPKGFGYAVPADSGYFVSSREKRLEILESIYAVFVATPHYRLVQIGCEGEDRLRYPDGEDDLVMLGGVAVADPFASDPGTILHRSLLEHVANGDAYVAFSATHVWTGDLQNRANLLPD